MANIGTLFHILLFLGITLSINASSNLNPALGFNDPQFDSDTPSTFQFSYNNVKYLNEPQYRIVIDAGHGGHDHGCSGKNSDEKHITLEIARRLGAIITKDYPDIEVIYTRTSDHFIPLHERIDLANKKDADLFLSIHANAFKDILVSGTEVFVMGLHTAEENLRVAQRENASVLLEDDFEKNYDGFDPNSAEAQIILSMYQNAYLDKSISLAKKVVDAIAEKTSFINRGVKQAGFVILRKAAMPSILIETGFLSNESDEIVLNSPEGQQMVAEAIASAIGTYKEEVEMENDHLLALKEKTDQAIRQNHENSSEVHVFRVQLGAFQDKKTPVLPDFIAGEAVDIKVENGLKKIVAGKFSSYQKAKEFQQKIRNESTYKEAFVVVYASGKRINISDLWEAKQ